MMGGLGEPEDPDRRDTENIPLARGEANPPPDEFGDPAEAPTHFVGKATVGAGVGGGGGGGGYSGSRSGADEPFPEFSEEELAGVRYDDSGVPIGPRRVLPIDDEPSTLVAKYLFPTERYRGEWKRHWIHLANALLIGVVVTFILGYVSGILAKQQNIPGLWLAAVGTWAVIMGWVAWRVADWYFDRFILTNKRLMLINGIITRRVAMMPLIKVTDMKYEQSPMGRLLSYGTFVLESAGQDQALRKVDHMPDPNELYLRIVEEMYEPAAVEARLGREPEEE
jgi:membrane protein YdbS with pleckstrin-like domain